MYMRERTERMSTDKRNKLKTPKKNKSIKEGFLLIRFEGSIPSQLSVIILEPLNPCGLLNNTTFK